MALAKQIIVKEIERELKSLLRPQPIHLIIDLCGFDYFFNPIRPLYTHNWYNSIILNEINFKLKNYHYNFI